MHVAQHNYYEITKTKYGMGNQASKRRREDVHLGSLGSGNMLSPAGLPHSLDLHKQGLD